MHQGDNVANRQVNAANMPGFSQSQCEIITEQFDEDCLSTKRKALICDALKSQWSRKILLSSPREDLLKLMHSIQEMLDDPASNDAYIQRTISSHRSGLCRLLVAMSKSTGVLPQSLFVQNVQCIDRNSVAGGAFSDIYEGSVEDKPVALKRLRVFRDNTEQRAKDHVAFCREALVWRQLQHKHILPFMGVDRDTFTPFLCMVSPWMNNGNIMNCMQQLEQLGQSLDMQRWISEIAEGLRYLHSERIVHGDLRGANILLSEDLSVQLADFGLSQFADASTASWGTHSGGAVRWLAPEVLSDSKSSYASDVYAFGCVCLEIHSRHPPFADIVSDAQVVGKVLRGGRPSIPKGDAQNGLWDLVAYCWNPDPVERPDIDFIAHSLPRNQEDPYPAADYDVVFTKSNSQVATVIPQVSTASEDLVDHITELRGRPSHTGSTPIPILSSALPLLRKRAIIHQPHLTKSHISELSSQLVFNSPNSSSTFGVRSSSSSPFVLMSSNNSSPFTIISSTTSSPPYILSDASASIQNSGEDEANEDASDSWRQRHAGSPDPLHEQLERIMAARNEPPAPADMDVEPSRSSTSIFSVIL